MSTVSDGLFQYGGVPVPIQFTGRAIFVDPVNGSDGNSGLTITEALKTLYVAHALGRNGFNDTVYLIGNGGTTASARMSLANAKVASPSATVGTLVWSKNALNLVGITAPNGNFNRARIAPLGTETVSNFGSGTMVSVTGQGSYFGNFSAFEGFATGGASEICWADTGGNNVYDSVGLQGGGDTSATTTNVATMRSLLISGTTGQNFFRRCTIGLDTLARSTGSFEMEITGGSPRNVFENCQIVSNAGAVGCSWLKIGASGIDRYVLFRDCAFINPIHSGASAMTTGFSVNGSPGGLVITQNCINVGATKLDTASQTYSNLAAAETDGGLGVVTG